MTLLRLIIIGFVFFIIIKVANKFKLPKVGSFALVSGGVKTGKSTLSVALVRREIRTRKIGCFISNLFRSKKNKLPMPLVYSNVPLSIPYVPFTYELATRSERFVYGSVIYIQEASLFADSQAIKDKEINEKLLLFNKLIGHETKGGCIIYDTQCINDCHYSIKRCISEYLYIHHLYKLPLLPFVIAKVREVKYSNDDSTINVFDKDVEDDLKSVLIPKKVWKMFDCYTYSSLTDSLPVNDHVVTTSDLKSKEIVTLKKLKEDSNKCVEKK